MNSDQIADFSEITNCLSGEIEEGATWVYNLQTTTGPYSHYRSTFVLEYSENHFSATMPISEAVKQTENTYLNLVVEGNQLIGSGSSGYGESFETRFTCEGVKWVEEYFFADKGFWEGGYYWSEVTSVEEVIMDENVLLI